jgi:hypothetical protein
MNAIAIAAAAALMLQSTAAPKPAAQKPAGKPAAAAAAATKTAADELPVTVTYKGKGAVDATHKILVWLFADPNINSNSRPVSPTPLTATKNGETLVFKNVTTSPVYVFAVYDKTGGYDGVSGPPPAGIPAGPYRTTAKGAPAAVKAGAPIKLTFDDSEPWNK